MFSWLFCSLFSIFFYTQALKFLSFNLQAKKKITFKNILASRYKDFISLYIHHISRTYNFIFFIHLSFMYQHQTLEMGHARVCTWIDGAGGWAQRTSEEGRERPHGFDRQKEFLPCKIRKINLKIKTEGLSFKTVSSLPRKPFLPIPPTSKKPWHFPALKTVQHWTST